MSTRQTPRERSEHKPIKGHMSWTDDYGTERLYQWAAELFDSRTALAEGYEWKEIIIDGFWSQGWHDAETGEILYGESEFRGHEYTELPTVYFRLYVEPVTRSTVEVIEK